MTLFGTEGSFEQNTAGAVWLTKNSRENIDDLLKCAGTPDNPYAPVHPSDRLPKEFLGHSNGHDGSHHFLVDDFVKACVSGKTPPNNAWESARYTVPGIIAHESALKGGVLMEVPDFGDPKF